MFELHIVNWPRNIMGTIGVPADIYVPSLKACQLRAMIYAPPLKVCELTAMLYCHTTCVPADIYVGQNECSIKIYHSSWLACYIFMLHAHWPTYIGLCSKHASPET